MFLKLIWKLWSLNFLTAIHPFFQEFNIYNEVVVLANKHWHGGLHEESILVQAVVGWYIYIYKYNMNSQGVNAKCSAGQWYCSKTCSRWYGESPVFVFICINWCWISVIEGEVIWSRKSPSQITKGRFKPMSNDEYAVEFVFRPKFPKNNHTGNWCFLAQTCSVPPVHKSCWIYLILVAPNPHMQWPSWPAHVATHSSLAESPWTLI